MKNLVKLFILIGRNGSLRHSGFDFPAARTQVLKRLGISAYPDKPSAARHLLMKNPYLRRWIVEAAYVKRCFGLRAGHFSTGEGKLSYVRIPKAASTSLSKAMLQTKLPHLGLLDVTAAEINYLADAHLETELLENGDGISVFTVVRNPFERIVSVYRQFFEYCDGPFIYQDYLFGVLHKDLSFRQFVDAVKVIPDKLKDQHLKPQYYFLGYYERRNIRVTIIHLDHPEDISSFLKKYDLAFESINRGAASYDYRDYYDQGTLEAVSAIYKVDIERFGYRHIASEIQSIIEHRAVQI